MLSRLCFDEKGNWQPFAKCHRCSSEESYIRYAGRLKGDKEEDMRNPIGWVEIPTADLERAKTFYGKVFALEFQFIDMPGYKMYAFGAGDMNAAGAAGALVQLDGSTPSADGSMVYFSCEDLSVELGRVEEAGGKVAVPKTDIGEYGFYARVIDTEGNQIGLHQPR